MKRGIRKTACLLFAVAMTCTRCENDDDDNQDGGVACILAVLTCQLQRQSDPELDFPLACQSASAVCFGGQLAPF